MNVANLYHMTNHTYLTTQELPADARLDALRALLKGFFFSLFAIYVKRPLADEKAALLANKP